MSSQVLILFKDSVESYETAFNGGLLDAKELMDEWSVS